MNINEAINLASKKIGQVEAKTLLKHFLDKDMSYIIANQFEELNENDKYFELVNRVADGYPLQYITHKQEFMGIKFYVDENVLIPQPDTEVLVENAIKYAKEKEKCKILDLCTGSGAIAISIKKYVPGVTVTATDISQKAIEVAKKNAKANNTDIEFIFSDMFENIYETFDLIVSNPPYIKKDVLESLPKDVKQEPFIALDGGIDGLDFYRIIAKNARKHLHKNGTVMIEIGYDQKEDVQKLFENSKCIKDYENRDRVIIWNLSQEK